MCCNLKAPNLLVSAEKQRKNVIVDTGKV